jgi:hypothetical protein
VPVVSAEAPRRRVTRQVALGWFLPHLALTPVGVSLRGPWRTQPLVARLPRLIGDESVSEIFAGENQLFWRPSPESRAVLMSPWPPRRGGSGGIGASLAGASPKGRSGRQSKSGAAGSELLVSGQHLPDRVREPAGDVDLGDLGPALPAEPPLCALVTRRVCGMPKRVHRRLQQRPAQVGRPVLAQGPAVEMLASIGERADVELAIDSGPIQRARCEVGLLGASRLANNLSLRWRRPSRGLED